MATALDALLHPVRWRIVQELGSGPCSTKELQQRMREVPQATVYRHIPALLKAGLIEVSGEQQVRGAVERTYALAGPMSADSADPDSFRRGFLHVLTLLQADLERAAAAAEADGAGAPLEQVSVSRTLVYGDEAEMAELRAGLEALVRPRLAGGRGRIGHVLGLVLVPDEEAEARRRAKLAGG